MLVLGILIDLPVFEFELVFHMQQLIGLVPKGLVILFAVVQSFESACEART